MPLDFDAIVIPGSVLEYMQTATLAYKLFERKNRPIILSGSNSQTDNMRNALDMHMSWRGYRPEEWLIDEVDYLCKINGISDRYSLDGVREAAKVESADTIENACNSKRIVRERGLGRTIAVVRADYHERAPEDFRFVYGPDYRIEDFPAKTRISQAERLTRAGHEKLGKIESLPLHAIEPGDDARIYHMNRKLSPLYRKMQPAEEAVFDISGRLLKLVKKSKTV